MSRFQYRWWIFAVIRREYRNYAAIMDWRPLIGRVWIKEWRKRWPAVRGLGPVDLLWDAFSFKEWEAEGWRDYAIIPLSLLKWTWAYIFWRFVLILARILSYYPLDYLWVGCSPNSRRSSPEPTICPRCLWAGQRRQCFHTYTEWEAVDECPRCGSEI